MRRHLFAAMILAIFLIGSLPGIDCSVSEARDLYDKTSSAWLPSEEEDGINLCYRLILLVGMDTADPDPNIQSLALDYAREIMVRQEPDGGIRRYRDADGVNSLLMTGIGAWALSVAYSYTGDEAYAEAARRAADFLMIEIDRWEDTYPAECSDERCLVARNGGTSTTSLTSYCWTSPNDLGLVALGIGAVVYYGAGGKAYFDRCCAIADDLYDMQLIDGSWYDGYALKLPTRWDRSVHYVTMAMMGVWMAYKISGDERYGDSLEEAWAWLSGMQASSGAVYDIWVDDANLHKAANAADHRQDFLQVNGDTNNKEYYSYPFKTFLGEFSFMLSGAIMSNVGLDAYGYDATKSYLMDRMAISNWYILSLVLEVQEPLRPYAAYSLEESTEVLSPDQGIVRNGSDDIITFGVALASVVVLMSIIAAMLIRRRDRGPAE